MKVTVSIFAVFGRILFLDSPRISQQNLFIAYWFLLLGAYEETTTPTAPSSQSSCRATSTGCRSLFRCLFYFSFTLIERNWYTWTVMSNKRVYIYICHQHLKSSTRPHHRPKVGPNGASGGSGMQAFFLESGRKSCGTGVFLPQRVGANSQASKKPGTYSITSMSKGCVCV
jgi:hypothetical protein